MADYFDTWGSRAYLFQPALGVPSCCSVDQAEPFKLLINPGALDDLLIRFILSTGEFTNSQELGLELVAYFDDSESEYQIWVYATGAEGG